MRSSWLFLFMLVVLASALPATAGKIARANSVPVTVDITAKPKVQVRFAPGEEVYLDVEAGYESAVWMVDFTASYSCTVRLTAVLLPPPGAPGGLTWNWIFLPERPGMQDLILSGSGEYDGRIKVHVKGVTPETPAGTYTGGVLTITIQAL